MVANAQNEENEISPERKIFLSGIVAASDEKQFNFRYGEEFLSFRFPRFLDIRLGN